MRTVVEERNRNLVIMDVFSKLIQERVIFIDGSINDELVDEIIAQLLHLDFQSNETIHIYINTPGGFVGSGLALFDVSKLIKSPIRTVCINQAASMGVILMLMGQERCALKHSKFLVHQIAGGAVGTYTDVKIANEQMLDSQKSIENILKEYTTIPNLEEVMRVDTWYNSEQALEYGIVTKIL